MAVGYAQDKPYTGARYLDNGKRWDGDLTLDTDYPTGGWVLDLSKLGFYQTVDAFVIQSFNATYKFEFNHDDQTLMAFVRATGDEAGAGLDGLANLVVRVHAEGR